MVIANSRIVGLLLIIQVISMVYLWSMTILGALSAARFAIFLAVDLLSFSMIGYVYIHDRWNVVVSRAWILLGSVGLIVLLVSSLFIN